jgi:hypothetical protein
MRNPGTTFYLRTPDGFGTSNVAARAEDISLTDRR